ncbi:DUF6233 domain-containing protein [Streptomyces sp. NPDC008222]|uniref:DUF6233 domain-containing protein n=1 Tax=Streptomyces sp. NPDC008222 TaxID=3364820 RepID=UPI0036E3AFB4
MPRRTSVSCLPCPSNSPAVTVSTLRGEGLQALEALRQQVLACVHCRPDTALGLLD